MVPHNKSGERKKRGRYMNLEMGQCRILHVRVRIQGRLHKLYEKGSGMEVGIILR